MISNGVSSPLCVCVPVHQFWFQGRHLYFSGISRPHATKLQHIEHVFNLSFLLMFLTFQKITFWEIRFVPRIPECVRLYSQSNGSFPRHLMRAFSQFPVGSWSQYQTDSLFLFFCQVFQRRMNAISRVTVKLNACFKMIKKHEAAAATHHAPV